MRLVSSFKPWWSEKMVDKISIFLNVFRLACVPSCGPFLKMFHVNLKRICNLLLWDERFYIFQLSPFNLMCLTVPQYPCRYFVWNIYPLLTVGVLKFPSISMLLSVSLLKSSKILVLLCWVHICLQYSCLTAVFFPRVL